MRKKDLTDVCSYFKGIIIPNMPDDFFIAEPFRHGLTDDELREGITAFRKFLYDLYDKLASEKNRFDVKKGEKYDPDNGEESTWKCFPVTKDITALLFFIGIHGRLEIDPNKMLVVYGSDLLTVLKPKSEKFIGLRKLSSRRLCELFDFLTEMGFYFEDLNFSEKINLSKTGVFYAMNENDSNIMVGLKLIAEAQANIKSDNDKLESAFMRCDFYPLADAEPKTHNIRLIDCLNLQPTEIRDWLIDLDKLLRDGGCSAVGDKSGDIHFTYTSRKSKKWVCKIEIGVSGFKIRPNYNHVNQKQNPNHTVLSFSEGMLHVLRSACCISCCGSTPCPNGRPFKFTYNGEEFQSCRRTHGGYKFLLNNAEDRDAIRKWIEVELACSY